MKAKDTVMSKKLRGNAIGKGVLTLKEDEDTRYTAEAQAEISFKAGQKARDAEWNEWKDRYIPEVIRNSRREVVEWIEKHGNIEASMTGNWFVMPDGSWQAFKKERGL